jgi:hypothetical protein
MPGVAARGLNAVHDPRAEGAGGDRSQSEKRSDFAGNAAGRCGVTTGSVGRHDPKNKIAMLSSGDFVAFG